MPSAYTEKLYNGEQSFEDFVLRCTRAMGAMIMFRDTSLDAKITEESFQESNYHDERLEEAIAELQRLNNLSDDELQAEVDASNKAQQDKYDKAVLDQARRAQRYNDMLQKVRAWKPPTEDHVNFKEWMINQLNESMDFDCHEVEEQWYPQYTDAEDYRAHKIAQCAKDITYHTERRAEDIARNKERYQWWKAVVDSLEG